MATVQNPPVPVKPACPLCYDTGVTADEFSINPDGTMPLMPCPCRTFPVKRLVPVDLGELVALFRKSAEEHEATAQTRLSDVSKGFEAGLAAAYRAVVGVLETEREYRG